MALYLEYQRRLIRRERVFRDRTNPLDTYNDQELIKKYRLSRPMILYLIDTLEDDLSPTTIRNKAIPASLQIFISLRVLASGSFQEVIGDGHGVSKASVSRKLHKVCQAICRHLTNVYIKFPTSVAEQRRVKEQFFEVANFPNVIGAVDGTLIPIKAPAGEDEHLYVSRKGGHAMNVQVVSRANLTITSVVCRYPATTHDSYIWRNCALNEKFENGDVGGGWLLGDSG